MVKFNLVEHELLELRDLQAKQFEVEIEGWDWCATRLVFSIVQSGHVGMGECLLNRNSFLRIKSEHFLNQIDSFCAVATEKLIEVLTAMVGERAHELAVISSFDLLDEGGGRFAYELGDHHHLFLLGGSGHQRLSSEKFSQDAADTPDVHGARVLTVTQDDFRGSVPSCHDIVSQLS